MMRLPFWPTLIVGAAIATMIGLGIWQLQRAEWKEGLIARYATASQLPPRSWPNVPPEGEDFLYRRATGFCTEVVGWRAVAGRSASGAKGWSHVAACRTGAEGPGMQVDMGFSNSSAQPAWRGGAVSGIVSPERENRFRLISDRAAPGLVPSAPPDPAATPNNHRMYAGQWFFFALAAAVIYILALRRRRNDAAQPPASAD